MNFDAVNKLSITFAVTVFCIFALTSFLVASSLFYAVYKERRLRIPSAMLVLNLCAAGPGGVLPNMGYIGMCGPKG